MWGSGARGSASTGSADVHTALEERKQELMQLKVEALKQECRRNALKVSGKKAELVERLLSYERPGIQHSMVASNLGIEPNSSLVSSLSNFLQSDDLAASAPLHAHLEALRRAVAQVYSSEPRTAFAFLPRSRRRLRVRMLHSAAPSDNNPSTSSSTSLDPPPQQDVQVLVDKFDESSGSLESVVDDTKEFWSRARRRGSDTLTALTRRYRSELEDLVQRERALANMPPEGSLVRTTVSTLYPSGFAVVEVGSEGTQAKLPTIEQLPEEELYEGQRIAATVLGSYDSLVDNEEDLDDGDASFGFTDGNNEAMFTVSRASPDMVVGAMQENMPAVASGDVNVQRIARLPGELTKVAVSRSPSISHNFDAVQECLGQNAEFLNKVREVIGGERVNLVRWDSDDIADRVRESLQPARCNTVTLRNESDAQIACVELDSNREKGRATGKGGVNVRLASELAGVQLELVVQPTGNVLEMVADDRNDSHTKQDDETSSSIDDLLGLADRNSNGREQTSDRKYLLEDTSDRVQRGNEHGSKPMGTSALFANNDNDDDDLDALVNRITERMPAEAHESEVGLRGFSAEELVADPLDFTEDADEEEEDDDDDETLESLLEGLEAPEKGAPELDGGVEATVD